MIDKETIRLWFGIFHGDNPLTEVRILCGKDTFSGYFTDVDTILESIESFDGRGGIYSPMNEINSACYGRSQKDALMPKKNTTGDNDIVARRWVLIDFDPERPSDTNANDAEKALAEARMRDVAKFLKKQGFKLPVVADSANGYHLYYRIDLPNTKEAADLVQRFLKSLDALYSDEHVKVDTSVFNASRISKIIGTTSNKGAGTAERPRRLSRFMFIPSQILVTESDVLKKVADIFPEPEAPSRANNWSTSKFDLDAFIQEHGIHVVKRSRFSGGEKLVLDECPFDHNHKDAAILHLDNGALSYKCFHNSCQCYGWKEFRLHYDPTAYDRQAYDAFQFKRDYHTRREPKNVEPVKEDARGKKWLDMPDIAYVDIAQIPKIPTGIDRIDMEIGGGLCMGDVTILSGLSGSGKTTMLNQLILSAVDRGFKVAAWSGELQAHWFQAWLDQTAAGSANVVKRVVREATYTEDEKAIWYAPKAVADAIHEWLRGKFWLYNNDYGADWNNLRADIQAIVEERGVNMILIDNLMALDLDGTASDNDVQTTFIKEIKEMAKKKNIHVVLVCHPRKEQSFQLLRKESIAGTANLTNLCDNLFIIHRIGRDFEKRAKEFLGDDLDEIIGTGDSRKDLVIEIAKNRLFGVVDAWCALFFIKESRRMSSTKIDDYHYGWESDPTVSGIINQPAPRPEPEEDDIPEDIWQNNF